ncbi:hypothetical protein [Aeromonas sp. 5HA1]|uniref:hypothetical protein n=1 Tax=Aeromonas sp. 5HA1 TaxID=2699197 RepID=UPI0023DDE153|nr:hypothetical protein [Aeromonas sp. 5HA1]MDF2401650.1 hypothetical protein [Aeromonas sp. 5HA1]
MAQQLPSSPPYAISSILLVPITILTSSIIKLSDLKEIGNAKNGLNRDEVRRLNNIIDIKLFRAKLVMAIILLSIAVVFFTFYVFSSDNQIYFRKTIIFSGALTGFSLYSVFWAWNGIKEIASFKQKIQARADAKKAKASALKRLKENTDN